MSQGTSATRKDIAAGLSSPSLRRPVAPRTQIATDASPLAAITAMCSCFFGVTVLRGHSLMTHHSSPPSSPMPSTSHFEWIRRMNIFPCHSKRAPDLSVSFSTPRMCVGGPPFECATSEENVLAPSGSYVIVTDFLSCAGQLPRVSIHTAGSRALTRHMGKVVHITNHVPKSSVKLKSCSVPG